MMAFFSLKEDSQMNLSPKAIRFMVEALEYRISAHEQQLEGFDLNEDEAADATSDLIFLKLLLEDFKKSLETTVKEVY
jgi:hypothetical protein